MMLEAVVTLPIEQAAINFQCPEGGIRQARSSGPGALQTPNFLLKIIPHVDGTPRGPAALSLAPHALAPVAELSVREIVSAIHIVADLTLGLGRVVHDYLQRPIRQWLPIGEESLAT
jgi:acetoacetate decarboxylase